MGLFTDFLLFIIYLPVLVDILQNKSNRYRDIGEKKAAIAADQAAEWLLMESGIRVYRLACKLLKDEAEQARSEQAGVAPDIQYQWI